MSNINWTQHAEQVGTIKGQVGKEASEIRNDSPNQHPENWVESDHSSKGEEYSLALQGMREGGAD